jgi:hypothetical protein
MISSRLRVVFVAAALAASMPAAAVGQQPAQSLHGTLPEGLTCLDCHTTEAWSPLAEDAAFEHADYGGFELEGRHADVSCALCHEGLVFDRISGAEDECASCHLDVHQGTIARPCSACHSVYSFTELDPGVVHPADYPLEGAHLQTSCESCHTDDLGGAYAPLDRECATCHLDDYLNAPLVDHEELGFSTDCTECHSLLDFRDVAFDHFTVSGGFELIGRHSAIECTACHSLPDGGLPTVPASPEDCIACHLDDYEDEHGGTGFPTDCLDCHTPFDWEGATFDHASVTGFELIGRHADIDCRACHTLPDGGLPNPPASTEDCVACHLADYESEHGGSGIPTDCLDCHTPFDWEGATFDHALVTGFALIEGHDQLLCIQCHVGSSSETFFAPSSPEDCYSCHLEEYQAQHAGTGFSTDCRTCHQVTTWAGATFDHTFVIDTGPHNRSCEECHTVPGDFGFFTCLTCHDQPRMDDKHQNEPGYAYDSPTCLSCHPTGTET